MEHWHIEELEALAGKFAGRAWEAAASQARAQNPWFTPSQISHAVAALREQLLTAAALGGWLSGYRKPAAFTPRRVGIVMAGNFPLAGFADLAAVVAVGHRAVVKPSSKDQALMEYVIRALGRGIETVEKLPKEGLDAVIATGGQEAYRAFRASYRDTAALLRGSRHSVAILDGTESEQQLRGLTEDLFWYWGLGCRSVVRLFVPEGLDASALARRLGSLSVPDGEPGGAYDDCYRYARAMAQMERARWADGGFFILRNMEFEESGTPRLAEIGWTTYTDPVQAAAWIQQHASQLQCVVGHDRSRGHIPFGRAQRPGWLDYADGIDTVKFLLNL